MSRGEAAAPWEVSGAAGAVTLSARVSSILVTSEAAEGRYTVIIACHPPVGCELRIGQAAGEACIRCNRAGAGELVPVGVIVPPVYGSGIALACPACVRAVLAS